MEFSTHFLPSNFGKKKLNDDDSFTTLVSLVRKFLLFTESTKQKLRNQTKNQFKKTIEVYPCDEDEAEAEACALDEAPPKPPNPPLCVFDDAMD